MKQLREWGQRVAVTGNPPAWVVSARLWERAKSEVLPHWETYRHPWAVVAKVYMRLRRAHAS